MKILVIAVASESSGAQTILEETYEDAKKISDKSVRWIFLLGKLRFTETDTISVINLPWVKKSWFHRLFFDKIYAPLLAIRYHADAILSLQNAVLPFVRIPQALNIHQSLPFSEYRFSFFEDLHLWLHQNVIGKFMIQAIKKADYVFFPTDWIKRACIDRTGKDPKKIEVISPKVNVEVRHFFTPCQIHNSTFFYPASGFSYKNHRTIIKACKILQKKQLSPFRVVFTLNGDETKEIRTLAADARSMKLPVEFIGSIAKEKVFEFYSKSVLLFPSFIEAFGLPLLECRLHRGVILAADTPFAREILDSYENAHFFNVFDAEVLADLMKKVITGELLYSDASVGVALKQQIAGQGILDRFLQLIHRSEETFRIG